MLHYVAKCDFHNISSTFSVIHKSEIGKRTQHTIHVYHVMKLHTQCKSIPVYVCYMAENESNLVKGLSIRMC